MCTGLAAPAAVHRADGGDPTLAERVVGPTPVAPLTPTQGPAAAQRAHAGRSSDVVIVFVGQGHRRRLRELLLNLLLVRAVDLGLRGGQRRRLDEGKVRVAGRGEAGDAMPGNQEGLRAGAHLTSLRASQRKGFSKL